MSESWSKYDRLINGAKQVSAVRGAVVHPCDESSLRGVVQAAANGLLIPVLVGPARRIETIAREHDLESLRSSLSTLPIARRPPPRPCS